MPDPLSLILVWILILVVWCDVTASGEVVEVLFIVLEGGEDGMSAGNSQMNGFLTQHLAPVTFTVLPEVPTETQSLSFACFSSMVWSSAENIEPEK